MVTPTGSSRGPAESRRVRAVFYLADGTMAGALLFGVVSVIFTIVSSLLSKSFTGGERLVFSFIIAVGLLIGTRNFWASLSLARSQSTPPVYHEWKAVRRWSGIAVVAVLIAAILSGFTVHYWGWGTHWLLSDLLLLMNGTLSAGLVLRMITRHTVSGEDGLTLPAGTTRGVMGFLMVLLGLVAFLVWGGVRMEIVVIILAGVGMYALLYLLVAAELN